MKPDTLIYEKKDGEVCLASVEDGKLAELDIYDDSQAAEGNVYLGKIVRKIELSGGNSGYLINIGDGKEAFLNAGDPDLKEINLSEGQSVVVQVAQEKRAEKGAKVVRNIQIVGTMLVYKPFKFGVDVSSKITDQGLAQQYKTTVWEHTSGQEGWTLRTAAVDFPIENVLEEMVSLRSIYENIRLKARSASAPALLYVRENPLYEYLRRHQDSLKQVVVNNHHLVDEINEMFSKSLAQYSDDPFEIYSLKDQIFEALSKTVQLKNGGRIHIEQTRAFVAVDVDSGHIREGENISRLNNDAAYEIARQIRLKNLAGKIIIDFAGSSEYRFMRPVIEILETELADDPCRSRVLGLSKAGNVEILRQRRRPSLLDSLTDECPTCQGTGRVEK